jgi:hypothetical protein
MGAVPGYTEAAVLERRHVEPAHRLKIAVAQRQQD